MGIVVIGLTLRDLWRVSRNFHLGRRYWGAGGLFLTILNQWGWSLIIPYTGLTMGMQLWRIGYALLLILSLYWVRTDD